MQSIELSSLASLLAASDGGGSFTPPAGTPSVPYSASASLTALHDTTFQ